MSNLLQELDFCNSIDSRLRVLDNVKPKFELPRGVQNATWFNQTNQNANSVTSTQYQLYLNQNQICSDYFIEEVDMTFNFTYTGNGNATLPFIQGAFGPRFMPLTNASQSIQIVINGQPVQVNCQDMLSVVCAFNKHPSYAGVDLPCCSELDVYSDLIAVGNQVQATLTNSINSPLGPYFNSTYGFDPRFGSVQYVPFIAPPEAPGNVAYPTNGIDNRPVTVGNQVYTRSIRFIIREPIFTGVTSMTLEQSGGYLSATNIQITRNWVSNMAAKMFNYAPIAQYNSVKVVINSASLYYQVYVPNDSAKLPAITFYPLVDYGIQSQTVGVLTNPGASDTINSQTLSLNVVPRCIYCWVTIPDSVKAITDTQCPGYQITNLQVSFNGVGGQFSSMKSTIELYDEFMGRAGCVKRFEETGYATKIEAGVTTNVNYGLWGSCLRIDSSILAGINWDQYSVGTQFNANLQIQVTFTNLRNTANIPSLFIQVVNDGLLMIDGPNSASVLKTVLDVADVMAVRSTKPTEFTHHPMMGGSFFGKIGNFFKKAYSKVLKPVGTLIYNNRDKLLPLAKAAATKFGLGRHRKQHRKKSIRKHGSAMLAEGLRRHRKRHHYRGGALEESDDERSCDSNCSCDDYSDSESYSDSSDTEDMIEEPKRGGAIISKSNLRNRLK